MLECMIAITLADGQIEQPEVQSIADTFARIMGQQTDQAELHSLAMARQEQSAQADSKVAVGPFEGLLTRLQHELPTLDDNGRELILESAFRVACADGEIEPDEDRKLRAIADVLAINPGVLELKIAQFKRQFAG